VSEEVTSPPARCKCCNTAR